MELKVFDDIKRDTTLDQLRKVYDEFYLSFLRKGKVPMGETEVGFWGASITDDIYELFEQIGLEGFNSFLDLGSGDGKVVLIASLFTKAAGIEFDGNLVKVSREMRNTLGLQADLVKGDFMEHDLSQYDVIFINPDKDFSKGLEEKLLNEMKGILIVYNVIYKPAILRRGKTFWSKNNIPIAVYTLK